MKYNILYTGIVIWLVAVMSTSLFSCSDNEAESIGNAYKEAVIQSVNVQNDGEWQRATQARVGTYVRIEGNNLADASALYFNGKEVKASEFGKSGNTYIETYIPQTTPLADLAEDVRNTIKVKTDVNEFTYTDFTILGYKLSVNGVRVFDGVDDRTGHLVSEAEIGQEIQLEGAGMDVVSKVFFNGYAVEVLSENRVASTCLRLVIPMETPLGDQVENTDDLNTIAVEAQTGEEIEPYAFTIKGPSVQVAETDIKDGEGEPITLLVPGNDIYLTGEHLDLVQAVTCNGAEVDFELLSDGRMRIFVPADLPVGEENVALEDMNKLVLTTMYGPTTLTIKIQGNEAPPVISSVSHTMARAGEFIYIWGENFEEGIEVLFPGNVEATQVEYISATEIKVTIPEDGDDTPGYITVVNPSGKKGYSYQDINCKGCLFIDFGSNNVYAGSNSSTYGDGFTMSSTLNSSDHPFPEATNGAPAAPDNYRKIPGDEARDITVAGIAESADDNRMLQFRINRGQIWEKVTANSSGLVTDETLCSDLALEFDVYMTCPWTMGVFRWFLQGFGGTEGVDRLTIAPWNNGGSSAPVQFYGGWRTFVMPLSELSAFDEMTVGSAKTTYPDDGNATWFIMIAGNFPDETGGNYYSGTDMLGWQMGFGNFRLVPYTKPVIEQE